MQKSKLVLLTLVALLWTGALFVYLIWRPERPKLNAFLRYIDRGVYAVPYSTQLSPLQLGVSGVPYYPFVETSPTQKKYVIVQLKERVDSSKLPLFYAHKRIAEIKTFYNEFDVNDWREQLNRYDKHIQEQLKVIHGSSSDFVRTTLFDQLNSYVSTHRNDILAVLADPRFTIGDNTQVRQIVEDSFERQIAQIPSEIREKNTFIYYPVDLVTQRQFGEYTLNVTVATESAGKFTLRHNGKEVEGVEEVDDNNAVFRTKEIEFLTDEARLDFSYGNVSSISARIAPKIIANETAESASRTPSLEIEVLTPSAAKLTLRGFSTSEQENLLTSLGKGWRATSDPTKIEQTTVYTLEFWPKKLLLLVIVGLPIGVVATALLFILSRTINHHRILHKILSSARARHDVLYAILRRLRNIVKPLRLPVLSFFVIGLAVDIVIFNRTSYTPLTVMLLVLWVLLALGYYIRERTHFALGVLFFLFIPPLLLVHREGYAEKLSSWAYIFFFAGTVELVIRQLYRDNYKDSIRSSLATLIKDLFKPIRWFFFGFLGPVTTFVLLRFNLFKKLCIAVVSFFLIFAITTNYTYQTNFFEKYYKTEPYRVFFLKTGLYELLALFTLFVVSFFVRKRVSLAGRWLLLLITALLIQIYVFRITTHTLRTEAVITELSKNSGTMWSEISIYGTNFGNAPYNGAAVYVDGVSQRILKWGNDEIIFVVDPINTRSGKLWVVNVDQKKTEEVDFEYIPL